MKAFSALRRGVPAIVVITLAALLVRATTATWTGLTTDEANGVAISLMGGWPDMLQHLKEDGNPPVFYVLTRLYASVMGQSDLSLKLFALALATLSVTASYLILRRFFTRDLACQSALMLALVPPLVRYSTLVRGYALMPLLSLFSTAAMMTVLQKPGSRVWPVLYGASTTAMILCHYWGAFVAIGQAATVAVAWALRWIAWRHVRSWLCGVAVSVLCFLPWVPVFLYQVSHNLSPWMLSPWLSRVVLGMLPSMFAGPEYSINPVEQYGVLTVNVLLLFFLLAPLRLTLWNNEGTEPPADKRPEMPVFDSRYWKLVAVMSALSGLLTTYFLKPVTRERYLCVLIPLFVVVFIAGFNKLTVSWPRWTRYLTLAAIWLPLWFPQWYVLSSMPETGTPAIVHHVEVLADRKKDLVLISWQSIAPAITFYMPDDIETITFPDLDRVRFNRWDGMDKRLRDPRLLDTLLVRLDKTLSAGGSVFLIDRARGIRETNADTEEAVSDAPFMDADMLRMDQIRDWLSKHAELRGETKMAPGRDFYVFLSVWRPRR